MTQTDAAPDKKERWSFSWKHLYDEVVTSGLCTGCAGCVIACPHDVLSYDDLNGHYKPVQIEDYGSAADCSHGDKACTSCTRACPQSCALCLSAQKGTCYEDPTNAGPS